MYIVEYRVNKTAGRFAPRWERIATRDTLREAKQVARKFHQARIRLVSRTDEA